MKKVRLFKRGDKVFIVNKIKRRVDKRWVETTSEEEIVEAVVTRVQLIFEEADEDDEEDTEYYEVNVKYYEKDLFSKVDKIDEKSKWCRYYVNGYRDVFKTREEIVLNK